MINYYQAFGLHFSSPITLPMLLESKQNKMDFEIELANLEAIRGSKATKIERKGIRCRIAQADIDPILSWEGVAKFQAIAGKKLFMQADSTDTNTLALFVVSEPLGLILYQRGYLLLHGSCVQIRDKAYVFLGTPGAGKSTTVAAFAKAGHRVLSDDLVAITADKNDDICVLPAYPQIKIWATTAAGLAYEKEALLPAFEGQNKYAFYQNKADFPTTPVSLGGIFILQKPDAKINNKPVAANKIPTELIKYFPLPNQLINSNYLLKHFILSTKIARNITLSKIRRPKNFDELKLFVLNFG